jgi:hypothetical protein
MLGHPLPFSLPRACEVSHGRQPLVLLQLPVAKKQRAAIVPQDTRRSVETASLDLLSDVGPMGLAAVAEIELFVVPPELKAAEGPELIAPEPENVACIEQLFYLLSVFDSDLFHCSVLPENLSAVAAGDSAFH